MGHQMAVLCNWGLHGREITWNGVPCYPTDGQWGNTNLGTFCEKHDADLVIALCDAWVLKPDMWPDDVPPVAVWAPVDHTPCPRMTLEVLAHPRVTPIAMSTFGLDEMRSAGLDPLYVPHGVDTRLFRPQPELRGEVRDELGLDRQAFVVGMVAANTGNPSVSRKAFPQALLAFTRFAEAHDDAWLYAHTQAKPTAGGMPLDVLADACGAPPGRVWFPNEKSFHDPMPPQAMAYLYQAFDVLLMPSMGEGFGIPLLEAQACGVPVITSDHSAMTELADWWLVDGDPWWDATQEAWFTVPHVNSIVASLEAVYDVREDERFRDRAVGFAAVYDAQNVAQAYWKPALADLRDRVLVAA
jgi:glycosyltransferase involved in cell wall biosynthesis